MEDFVASKFQELSENAPEELFQEKRRYVLAVFLKIERKLNLN
jgi:hypothetical protein